MFDKQKLNEDSYIIAEVGQNHQGDLDLAREYIKVFSQAGADAIKFQTRNNKFLFSDDAYNRPYDSDNAFSNVYGQHREALELKPEWLSILKQDCNDHNVAFMSTPFDEPSLELLCDVGVNILKVASFDIGNLPFIDKIGSKRIPVVMSIGGGRLDQITASMETLMSHHKDVALLHCVSEYPCELNRLGLDNIQNLIHAFPDVVIGLSDHFNGILTGPIGYMKGARVFEKHVTLNRAWKGTDHSFALERHGFESFARDIRRVKSMMISKPQDELGTEYVFQKLGKSIVASVDLKPGDVLSLNNLSGKIFSEQFLPVRQSKELIGKKLIKPVRAGEPISRSDFV